MVDLFNSKSLEKALKEEICVVYILYFDEAKGHVPLLIFPFEEGSKLKDNKRFMRPIKYHPVWFLSIEEQEPLDHIDLEFKGYTFFGKKFLTKSKRKKRRAGLKEESPEIIVVIASVSNDIAIFGDELIHLITEEIKEKFDDKLFKIIECEIAKDEIIKTPEIKKIINEGMKIKKDLNNMIDKITENYFHNTIKQKDTDLMNQQKALSYLALKGIDVSAIGDIKKTDFFLNNIKLFDPSTKAANELALKTPFIITNVSIIEDSQELEITVQNNTGKEIKDVIINITHLKEFFEKEIMEQDIDLWFPEEELLFISPIIPNINDYLFFITKKENKEKIFKKLINLKSLKSLKN
ncbi:MAG: hypothetical protein EU540_03510 [Promethearchaeota archaeon]|nr:MAG: hypothetical protein EU540_03510 [Candidatus Lokiarchaeota archaeon]